MAPVALWNLLESLEGLWQLGICDCEKKDDCETEPNELESLEVVRNLSDRSASSSNFDANKLSNNVAGNWARNGQKSAQHKNSVKMGILEEPIVTDRSLVAGA